MSESLNLSKIKRDKLINKLHQIKENCDDETFSVLSEIETELTKTPYGLVWEEHSEQVDDDMKTKIPVFVNVKGKEIKANDSNEYNFILEGDNLHSLKLLKKTHKGKIKAIYIDPPYNTGGTNDFVYNDKRIDSEDGYKHSKWLSFMEKRLTIAKTLLTDDGVMFISIDDHEYANLFLLCQKIFDNKVETMIWRKSGDGRDGKMKNTKTFRIDHEYIVICYKNKMILNKILEKPNFINTYPNPDNDPRGPYKAGSISRTEEASNKKSDRYYTVVTPTGKKITRQFDIPEEEFLRLASDKVVNKDGKEVSRIYWGKNDDAVPSLKIFVEEERKITPYSMLLHKGTTTEGTKEATELLGFDCSSMRPKPSYLIQTLIQLASNDGSIILDFFAGTGTTAQAVMQLNRKYGGNRKFILCTNNENNICEDFTYERTKILLTGERKDGSGYCEPYNQNLLYYKTDFINKKRDGSVPSALMKHVKELIQLEHHCKIDNKKIVVAFDEDELDKLFEKDLSRCKKLFIPREVFLDTKQKSLLNKYKIEKIYIPEYYFARELKEIDEL